MSTNIRQSLGNGSERGDQEHQIRIEISKTEVLDSMKKDQLKDLSLLYYDFNNSKARLMSKMKKMSDFIIKEEAGDDGDGAAQHPESQEKRTRKSKHQSENDIFKTKAQENGPEDDK